MNNTNIGYEEDIAGVIALGHLAPLRGALADESTNRIRLRIPAGGVAVLLATRATPALR